jgi:hypothetical protein
MLRVLTFAVLLLLAALSAGAEARAPAAQGTGFAYMPLTPGGSITYSHRMLNDAVWDDRQMVFTVRSQTPVIDTQVRHFSAHSCKTFFGGLPLFVQYQVHEGQAPQPVEWSQTLTMAVQTGTDQQGRAVEFLGEVLNNMGPGGSNNVVIPGIPAITRNPVAGEEINENFAGGGSAVYEGGPRGACTNSAVIMGGGGAEGFRWRYRTVRWSREWGPYKDVWLTGLREYLTLYGQPADRVYNFIFMRGVGLVGFWYGMVDARGRLVPGTGHSFMASGWNRP